MIGGNPLAPPEHEDAADLTDQEVASAVETQSLRDLVDSLTRAITASGYTLSRQELRRRKPHLYLRSTLVRAGAPERRVIHRVDWLPT